MTKAPRDLAKRRTNGEAPSGTMRPPAACALRLAALQLALSVELPQIDNWERELNTWAPALQVAGRLLGRRDRFPFASPGYRLGVLRHGRLGQWLSSSLQRRFRARIALRPQYLKSRPQGSSRRVVCFGRCYYWCCSRPSVSVVRRVPGRPTGSELLALLWDAPRAIAIHWFVNALEDVF